MSAMTDEQVGAELERIDKERGTGYALVYKAACDFVDGIPLKGIDTPGDSLLVETLRLLAESQQALGEIHGLLQHQLDNEEPDDLVTILQLLDALMIIASKHWKGGK